MADAVALRARPRVRYRYRVRLAGLLFLAVTLLLGVAAATRPNNLLVWIFGLMLGSILVSGVVSGFMLMKLSVRRLDPRRAVAGEPAKLRYEVVNRSKAWSAFGLSIRERPVGGVEGWDRFCEPASAGLVHVGPGETMHAETWILPRRRGRLAFREIDVSSRFPFGLIEKVLRIEHDYEVLVHPRVLPVRAGVLAGLRSGRGGGLDASPRPGDGEEFFGLRDYRPGDSIRQIAWKRLAGLGRLATIERSTSGPPRLVVSLDLRTPTANLRSGEIAPRELEERAITIAASLAAESMRHGYEVGLEVLGLEAPRLPVRSGHWHLERMLGALAALGLDQPRIAARAAAVPVRTVRATIHPVHPARLDRDAPEDGWTLVATQFDRIVEAPSEAAR
ncbi:MAG: hypothetical protein RJA16_736 [Planctomycetota bacterium]